MKFNELPTAAKIPLEPGTDSLEVHAPLNVVVLEPTGADSVDPQDETATVLAAAAESLQAVRSGQSRVEATSSPLRIHHRSQLVNEYEGFKHLMEGMFPTPFLFGCPYEKIPRNSRWHPLSIRQMVELATTLNLSSTYSTCVLEWRPHVLCGCQVALQSALD